MAALERGSCRVVPIERARRRAGRFPTISIVTCSYQQARYLEQAMRSVLEQDYPALEYIVIDGGSCDGSRELIERHAKSLEYWVSESDRGQTDALSKGFRRARGEICGWLCSDDLLLPGALRAVAAFFRARPEVAAAYGDALWIDDSGRFLRPKREMGFSRFVLLHDHNYVPQPSMFWRRSLYESVGGLDPGFDMAMDADLWERFSRCGRIGHIPRYLSCMRSYPEQKTLSRRGDGAREDAVIRIRGGHLPGGPLAVRLNRLAARGLRIVSKAAAGGYGAAVPPEHLVWLERCASSRAAEK
jgi:glycosyltransferase involved in cell wall biosynthesis